MTTSAQSSPLASFLQCVFFFVTNLPFDFVFLGRYHLKPSELKYANPQKREDVFR